MIGFKRGEIEMNKSLGNFTLLLILTIVLSTNMPVFAQSIEEIRIIKISPQDERAVIKTTDRELKIIKVGDSVGQNGKITEITKGRVVIDERTADGIETVIIRFENGNQKIERIKKVADKQPLLYKPQTGIKD